MLRIPARTLPSVLVVLVVLALLVPATSCAFFTRAVACTSDAECLDQQRCSSGTCVDVATNGEGEGEGVASEGEGEGVASEGEGEGEGVASEGEGEGEGGEGEGEGEGEGVDCTPLLADEFDGNDVVPPFAIVDQPPNDVAVVSGGRFVIELTSSQGPAYAGASGIDVRDTAFTAFVADPPSFDGNELFVAGAFADESFNDGTFADIFDGSLRLVRRESGNDNVHSVAFDVIAHRAIRLRFLDTTHQAVLEASPDGNDFTQIAVVNASSTANASPAYYPSALLGYGAIEGLFAHNDTVALDSVKLERNACLPPP